MPIIEIENLPDKADEARIGEIVEHFAEAFGQPGSSQIVEIIFVVPNEMQSANLQHRGIDKSTDVLSFPQADQPHPVQIWGTILISPEDAEERDEDIYDLLKHGLLHLAGFDHESDPGAWAKAAKKINHKMGI